MRSRTLIALTLGLPALFAGETHACAGCRNPNMPVTRVETIQLRPGEIRAGLSLGTTGAHITHEAGCADLNDCHEQPIQPLYLHDQRLYPAELRAVGEWGVTPSLGIEAQVPLRWVRTSIEYATPEGQPYQPLDPDIHHRDETLFGIGDPWLLARWSGTWSGVLVSTRLGFSIPMGSIEPNPFALGDSGRRHQHIQFGTGTLDPIFGLDLSLPQGRWLFLAYAQGQMAIDENKYGYQAGMKMMGGVQAGRRIWRALTGALGVETLHEGAERWDGEIKQDGSLGRTEILLTFSGVYAAKAGTWGISARVPVYRHIVAGDEPPGNFSSPLMLGIFGSKTFKVM